MKSLILILGLTACAVSKPICTAEQVESVLKCNLASFDACNLKKCSHEEIAIEVVKCSQLCSTLTIDAGVFDAKGE